MTAGQLLRPAVTAGIFDPVPVVNIDGVDVASGGPASALMALDGLSVTWGRDELLEQPTTAVAALELFDPSRTWATTRDRRGVPVTLRYTGLAPDGSTVSAVFFRGRIAGRLTVSRRTVRDPLTGTQVDGSLVQVPLQSVLVDLANNVPTVDWPVETMGARFDRVVALAQAAGFLDGGGLMRDYWRPPQVAAITAANQVSLYDHLVNIYTSCGDVLSYLPDADQVRPVQRRDFSGSRTRAQLWWDNDARDDAGAYARTPPTTNDPATPQAVPLYLDAATLEYEPADGITTPERISRVALAHPNMDAAWATRNVEARVRTEEGGVVDERLTGSRTAKVDSLLGPTNWADVALSDFEFLVRREGSQWRLEPLVLKTRKTGGFETVAAAQWLLGGYETQGTVFLQRSWLPDYRIRPVFGVMGGRIAYRSGGWELAMNPAPISTTPAQHAVSWSELDDGSTGYTIEWHDEPHPKGLHPTLTYEDLAFVGLGLGVTTVPPDQGFDR